MGPSPAAHFTLRGPRRSNAPGLPDCVSLPAAPRRTDRTAIDDRGGHARRVRYVEVGGHSGRTCHSTKGVGMWAVIGAWEIDASLIEELRALVPEMAKGKVGMPGFVHGTWTQDGHVLMFFADEQSARRYHGDMLSQVAVERPGLRGI